MDTAQLRLQQQAAAKQLILRDQLDKTAPTLIAGADVGFEQQGSITRGVLVLLAYPALKPLHCVIFRTKTSMPYIPGLLSFREYPALLNAWQTLPDKPDLLLVDGQGIAHPRGLGLASHIGLLADVPSIGVAKSRLYGRYNVTTDSGMTTDTAAMAAVSNSSTAQPLFSERKTDNPQQIGWVWQSKARCNPLYISPGHRISISSALVWVQRCMAGYRLPEPTRLADIIASRRSGCQCLLEQMPVCRQDHC